MAVIHQIKKTKTKLDFEITSQIWNDNFCYIVVSAANYFKTRGSLNDLYYSLDNGNTWNSCSLPSNKLYTEKLIEIPGALLLVINLTGNYKKFAFKWDAAADLDCMVDYFNIKIKLLLYDEAYQAGDLSDPVYYTIDRSWLTPNGRINLDRPHPSENVFDVSFFNLVAYATVNCHFKIEIDTVNTFNSGDYKSFNSETNQTGWTVDGGAFPVAGAPSVTDRANRQTIIFSDAILQGLDLGNYYMRIIPSLHDPAGIKSPGVWNPVTMKFE